MQNPIVSEECRKRGICAEVENYPTELAKRLIREVRILNKPLTKQQQVT